MKLSGLTLGAAIVSLAWPSLAQTTGATELKVAVPIKGAPSSTPVADVYYLVGEAGATETYTLTSKGPASLTLFGPDGSEILTVSGSGSVKLEAVLPFTDVFTIAVARASPAPPYSLNRKATEPSVTEAILAAGVGYDADGSQSSQCWVVPGVKLRVNYPNGREEFTVGADRKTVTIVSMTPKGTHVGDLNFTYDGETVQRTGSFADGKTKQDTFPVEFAYDPQRSGKFVRYLCDDRPN